MNEFGKLFREVSFLFRNSKPEKRLEIEAKQEALGSVSLFLNAENQVPQATFLGRKNIFHLTLERSGSIFRIAVDRGTVNPNYFWYVVGRDNEKNTYIWEIWKKSIRKPPQLGGELRISNNDIMLVKVRPKKNSFSVPQALLVLHGVPMNYAHVQKLDRMWAGVAKKAPGKDYRLRILTPAYQGVENV